MTRPVRVPDTPAAANASFTAASDRVETAPSPPAAANASATTTAHPASASFAIKYCRNAATTPAASIRPHPHRSANEDNSDSKDPGTDATPSSSPREDAAKLRNDSGRADDAPPPYPPPGPGVSRDPEPGDSEGNDGAFPGSIFGRASSPQRLSPNCSSQFRLLCRRTHSL
ncbi:hypothetical protein ACR30Z_22565, partial [Paenarthrobacter sp. FR1]